MEIPKKNYVGLLQEKCQASYTTLPKYHDVSMDNEFKFKCTFNNWTCHGIGASKKFAKQNSAKEMLEKIESENLLLGAAEENKKSQADSSVSKLNMYCSKEKIDFALYSELPREEDQYCCQCSFKGFTVKGRGNSKKEAKEKAASLVVEHFKINNYMAGLKEQVPVMKSSVQELNQFCQKRRLGIPTFEDEEIKVNNAPNFKVTCLVGDLRTASSLTASKKAAKLEAATLMLQSLKNNTPQASPVEADEETVKKELSPVEADQEVKKELSPAEADQKVKKELFTTEHPDESPTKRPKRNCQEVKKEPSSTEHPNETPTKKPKRN